MYLSLGAPCFEGGLVPVVGMGAHMVISGIGEFLHCLGHLLLRPEFIQIGAFVLQSVEVPFHRCVRVRTARSPVIRRSVMLATTLRSWRSMMVQL